MGVWRSEVFWDETGVTNRPGRRQHAAGAPQGRPLLRADHRCPDQALRMALDPSRGSLRLVAISPRIQQRHAEVAVDPGLRRDRPVLTRRPRRGTGTHESRTGAQVASRPDVLSVGVEGCESRVRAADVPAHRVRTSSVRSRSDRVHRSGSGCIPRAGCTKILPSPILPSGSVLPALMMASIVSSTKSSLTADLELDLPEQVHLELVPR